MRCTVRELTRSGLVSTNHQWHEWTLAEAAGLANRYRSPASHYRWNDVLGMIVRATTKRDADYLSDRDSIACTCDHALSIEAPARYLSADIIAAFMETHIPTGLPVPEVALPAVVLMLPRGALPATHAARAKLEIAAILVTPSFFQSSKLGKDIGHGLACVGLATYPGLQYRCNWTWENGFGRDIPLAKHGDDLGDAIRNIAVNAWLTMAWKPELVTLGDLPPSSSAGRGFNEKGRKVPLAPTWIGWNYQQQTVSHGKSDVDSQRGPVRSHWRRGHWHTICHGAGRKLRRSEWFRPVYVNGAPQA